ncbi:Calx-beta domain-containing protein [Thalassotalea castellviae]|uniref:Calx-beta domain-containing protein n=1 Tax=Thalassotalea castellviae TaxID=3075612 RepID=A0ABU3A5F5_9GAMM|nr:Calx-beta domain-containing protein [Thalassotalea sp. W431]MDT0605204.1 Calx-beta domain-containing protein [Thalassotalea sp. W431]
MKRLLATVILSLLPLTSSAIDLFNWEVAKAANKTTSQFMSSQAYSNAQNFSVDTKLLKDHQINDIITINLTENESYQAKITKIKRKQNGIVHIFAKINHKKEATPVVLTLGKKQFFFRIVTNNQVYVAQGSNNQGKLLNEQRLTKANKSHISDVKIPEESPRFSIKSPQNQQVSHNKSQDSIVYSSLPNMIKNPQNSAAMNNNDMATIKVLFVYSLTAETLYDGDVTTRLNHLVEVTNQIYLDSEVNMQIAIADTLAVDYPDEILSEQALDDITYQSHEAFTNIENIRYEAGADMVALLRPNMPEDTVCGIAWGNREVNNSIGFMYSHTSIDCADYVNAHEMGHNMGLAHSLAQGDTGYSFPFARGYRVEDVLNGFSTVMAYSTATAGKVYKFSNPNILCTEIACGIDRNDTVNGADASYALNQLRFQLANIMDTETDLTLASDALNNIESSGLKACLENQINNYDITYAGQVRDLFCSYRNISSLSGLEKFSGLTSIYLNGNNLTDISVLSTLTKLATLSLSNNNITHLSSLASLLYLNYLTVNYNQITSFDGLENLNYLSYLNATDNQISDISAISDHVTLETLLLENNQITDITDIQDLENLSWLSISNNKITDLPSLANLTKLTQLYLNDNQLSNISGLNALREIQLLDIENNMVSDLTPLNGYRNLQSLTLSQNPITNLDSIIYLNNLTTLNATNTNITDLSALFNLHNTWSQIRLFGSDNLYCWQVNYVEQFIPYENYQQPTTCNTNTDDQDIDNDGVSNSEELTNNTNPLYNTALAGELSFQIEQLNLNEINQTVTLKVIRSLGDKGDVKVTVRSVDQTATGDDDYKAIEQILTLSDKQLFQTFTLDIFADEAYEINESFTIELTDPDSATLGDKSKLNVTLKDNGGTALSWQETSNAVDENSGNLTLTITRPNDALGEMSVDISAIDDTAINGTDYVFEDQTITFYSGEYSKDVSIVIIDNDEYQGDKSFSLMMTNPNNAYIEENTGTAIIVIQENETPARGEVTFESSTVSFNEDAGEVTIKVVRLNGSYGQLSVNLQVSNDTATQSSDFDLSNGTITFLADEIEQSISFSIVDDTNDESDETFTIALSAEDSSIIGEFNQVTVSIIDNDETVVTPPTPTPDTSSSGGGGSTSWLLIIILFPLIIKTKKSHTPH